MDLDGLNLEWFNRFCGSEEIYNDLFITLK